MTRFLPAASAITPPVKANDSDRGIPAVLLNRCTLPALATVAALSAMMATPVWSGDARSIALGGSVIANGQGVHGALENPASLMAMKRRKEKFHFLVGMSAEIRDTGDAIDTLSDDDNQGLIDDLEREIDILSSKEVQCDPLLGSDQDICVEGTQPVADLSTRLLDILDVIDEETIDGQGNLDLGIALTKNKVPMAVNLRMSATGAGRPDIAEEDMDYIQEFEDLLGDDQLLLEELRRSEYIEASALGVPLGVDQPEDVLSSEAQGSALLRTQLGISFAATFQVGEFLVDAGVTPKFSSLKAYNVDANVRDEFDDSTPSLQDRFDDSEVTESSFTVDVGASMALKRYPLRLAATVHNLIPESIETTDGYEFETSPQLVVGALFQRGMLSVNGDLALNEGKVDNFATQKMGVGVEYGTAKYSVRGGLSHDASRAADATAVSFGVGLGPFQIGGRLSGLDSLEAGAQVAYSFK
ncbi:MAG: conjugal transfer protein TraF [Granulosicoccus sp.]|nr:conjugal transfer protein TraF [Granulosicoccus sp.]